MTTMPRTTQVVATLSCGSYRSAVGISSCGGRSAAEQKGCMRVWIGRVALLGSVPAVDVIEARTQACQL